MDETEPGSDDDPIAPKTAQPAGPIMLGRGDRVGRYVVANILGLGGMGVVHAAHDPKLDRRVALKLLRPRGGPARRARGRARLLREAQALAQLNHPNVVTVHDVGEHGEQVFIAMEYVEGTTLKGWLEAGPHSWQRVLEVMIAAGRGLVAAHAKKMVHRDFKPENVMLTDQARRVLVMDFGLVTAPEFEDLGQHQHSIEERHSGDAQQSITRTGSALGTPAYMAPEQFTGHADLASDQFSFCVTLFEALYGKRPFDGATMQELARAIIHQEVRAAPAGSEVPRWLREVILRGLSTKPRDRWPSMKALVTALGSPPRRKRWPAFGVAGVALTAGGLFTASQIREHRRTVSCADRASAMDAVWNDATRARLAAAFASNPLPYSDDAWSRAASKLDAASQAWSALRMESCLAEPTTRPRLRDARDACLEDRLGRMGNVIRVLETADGDVVHNATAVSDINIEACRDDARLWNAPPRSGHPAFRVARLQMQRDLHYANSIGRMDRFDEATGKARSVLEQARALGDIQMQAQAHRGLGLIHVWETRYRDAATSFEEAYFLAMQASDRQLAADLSRKLIGLHGDDLTDAETARQWVRHSTLLTEDSTDQAKLDVAIGRLELAAGNLERAETLALAALGQHIEDGGAHSEHATHTRMLLVAIYDRMHEPERALNLSREVLDARIEVFGEDHPTTLKSRINLGAALVGLQQYDEAESHLRRAAAGLQPPNLDTADAMNNLSLVMQLTDRSKEAADLNAQVLAVRRAMLSDDNLRIAEALINAAQIQQSLGHPESSLRHAREARSMYMAKFGEEHVGVLHTHRVEGATELIFGSATRAREAFENARAIQRRIAPNHPMGASIDDNLAISLLDLGEARRALVVTSAYLEDPSLLEGIVEEVTLSIHTSQAYALLELGRVEEAREVIQAAIARARTQGLEPTSIAIASAVLYQANWVLAPRAEKAKAREKVRAHIEALGGDEPETVVIRRRLDAWLKDNP